MEIRKKFFNKRGKTVKKVVLRSGGSPVPGQVGWDSEQRGLAEDVPVCWRGFGLDGL